MKSLRTLGSLAILTVFSAGSAFAGGTPQNHHCMKDGAELTGKTHKECTKEGGKWAKMTAAKPADATKPADTTKPAEAAKPAEAPAKTEPKK
jgi:hypothetical protein